MSRKSIILRTLFFISFIFSLMVIIGSSGWQEGIQLNFNVTEDQFFLHDFSQNLSFELEGNEEFKVDSDQSIFWINYLNTSSNFSGSQFDLILYWMNMDLITGNFTINSTSDNETGLFNIPMRIDRGINQIGWKRFNFTIYAVNDPPEFDLEEEYVFGVPLTGNVSESITIVGEDEEEHYPLRFHNTTFFENCIPAEWSSRNDGGTLNCEFNPNFLNEFEGSNKTIFLNFTNFTYDDVGIYPIQICINDTLPEENESLPLYRVDDYDYNQTSCQNTTLIIQSSLYINSSDCNNNFLTEENNLECNIVINTQVESSNLTIWSNANLPNHPESNGTFNQSWFYSLNEKNSSLFQIIIPINISLGKSNIGNWTINFSVNDTTVDDFKSEIINVFVNRTVNSTPQIDSMGNLNFSAGLFKSVSFFAYDEDFLIPDKNENFIGYNESLLFNLSVFNQSNLDQEIFSGVDFSFELIVEEMPVLQDGFLTNKSKAKININSSLSNPGEYLFNVSVQDKEGFFDFELFNVSIMDNQYPEWSDGKNYTIKHTVNSSIGTTQPIIIDLIGDDWILHDSPNQVNISTISSTPFNMKNFNFSSNGVISFTPYKEDVGIFILTLEADFLGLKRNKNFTFNISNINTAPIIDPVEDLNKLDNETIINILVWVRDDDLGIVSSGLKENLSFNWKIFEIINEEIIYEEVDLFNFSGPIYFHTPPSKFYTLMYEASFVPKREDVGNYTVIINVTDKEGASDQKNFTLEILRSDQAPNLSEIKNLSSAINRTLYYRINASHIDDGFSNVSGNQNFTFNFSFLNGEDFLSDSIGAFNETTGEINFTFNESIYSGKYHLNITVNVSSTNLIDWTDFWIFVYDKPSINFPDENFIFENLTENLTSEIIFNVNHSIGDNLTYEFLIDRIIHNISEEINFTYTPLILRENVSFYGNGTNFTFNFTPNFYDETYGLLKNLTLIVYPSNPELKNSSEINLTHNWKINISHSNAPMIFFEEKDISAVQISVESSFLIDLKEYFYDVDAFDSFYNQEVEFILQSNKSNLSSIEHTLSEDWILTLSSSTTTKEILNITGRDLNDTGYPKTNATSNNFVIEFIPPDLSPPGPGRPPTSTTQTTVQVASLLFKLPGPFFVQQGDTLSLTGSVTNDGASSLSGIFLDYFILKDGLFVEGFDVSISPSQINSLNVGSESDFSIYVNIVPEISGIYELFINANVNSPSFSRKDKIILLVGEEDIRRKLLFVEELITVDHPECLEALEAVKFAENLISQGEVSEASKLLDDVVRWCKDSIVQSSEAIFQRPRFSLKKDIYWDFFGPIIALIMIFSFFYFFYRKIKIRRLLKTKS